MSESGLLRVLLVEDSADDAELILRALRGGGLEIESQVVASEAELRVALAAFGPDLVLVDWTVPAFSGEAAATISREWDAAVPVILVSGTVGDGLVVHALRAKATDYVSKRHLEALVPAVQRALGEAATRREQARLEGALAASQARLGTALETMLDGVIVTSAVRDEDGRIVDFRFEYSNPASGGMSGVSGSEQTGHTLLELFPAHHTNGLFDAYVRVVETGVPFESGSFHYLDPAAAGGALDQVLDQHAAKLGDGYVLSVRDVTARHALEAERTQLASIIDRSPDATMVVGADMRITYANAAFAGDLGWTQSELVGRSVLEVVDGALDAATIKTLVEVARAGQPWLGEVGRRLADGTAGRVQIRVTPRRAADGTLDGYVLVSRDVSELRAAESELSQTEELRAHLAAIVESSSDAIVGNALDGTIVSWNLGAEELHGYTEQEIVGRPISLLAPPNRLCELEEILDRIKRGEMVEPIETTRVRKSGDLVWVSLTSSPIRDADGRITGASTIARDISARKAAEARLESKVQELARSNEELSQFAYIASHDLQEPLRMVASYTQLLSKRYKGQLDSDADEFIAFAVDGATRMQRLIEDLLAYSRVGTKGTDLLDTSSEDALQQALLNLRGSIEESGALVTHDPLPAVMADEMQLIQLFQNLVGNALKYRRPGVPRVHVSAARVPERRWSFAVTDNGLGIDPQYFDRIFGMFQRLQTREEYAGTGIGLAICKKIVERHGGSISAESQPGLGSTFRFTLAGSEMKS